MALNFETCTDANRNDLEGKRVTYSSEPYIWGGNDSYSPCAVYWKVRRNCTRRYEYLGLSKANAESEAARLQAEFTQSYMRWTADVADVDSASLPKVTITKAAMVDCSTEVMASPVEGNRWKVTVAVNDSDEVIVTEEITDPAKFADLFQSADIRDATTGTIAINSAKWNGSNSIFVNFTAKNIPNFDHTAVRVVIEGTTPQTITPTETATRYLSFAANVNRKFHLTYGTLASGSYQTNNVRAVSMTIQSFDLAASGSGIYAKTNYTVTFTSDAPDGALRYPQTVRVCTFGTAFESTTMPASIERYSYDSATGVGTYIARGAIDCPPPPWGSSPTAYISYVDGDQRSAVFSIPFRNYLYLTGVTATAIRYSDHVTHLTLNVASDLERDELLNASVKLTYQYGANGRLATNATNVRLLFVANNQYQVFADADIQPGFTSLAELQLSATDVALTVGGRTVTAMCNVAVVYDTVSLSRASNDTSTTASVYPMGIVSGKTGAMDWGDGTAKSQVANWGATLTHSYAQATANDRITIQYANEVRGTAPEGENPAAPWVVGFRIGNAYLGSIVTIGDYSFIGQQMIYDVNAPFATSVGQEAFAGCSHISSVSFPELATIGQQAFSGCVALTSIELPEITAIGDNAFEGCANLMLVKMPNRTAADAQTMNYLTWALPSGATIRCSDGEISVEY